MDSIREKIAKQLEKPKLNINLICEILKELADAIDAPKKKASTPVKKNASTPVKKKAAPEPTPVPEPTPEPTPEPEPTPAPAPVKKKPTTKK